MTDISNIPTDISNTPTDISNTTEATDISAKRKVLADIFLEHLKEEFPEYVDMFTEKDINDLVDEYVESYGYDYDKDEDEDDLNEIIVGEIDSEPEEEEPEIAPVVAPQLYGIELIASLVRIITQST
jgi:hypothetical protein